jgi:predicted HTH domain antitoxin
MTLKQLTINIPQDIAGVLPGSEVEQEVKRYLALKFYQKEVLTIGKAAELADMDRMEFEYFLAHNQIPVSLLDYDDFRADLQRMKNITAPAL